MSATTPPRLWCPSPLSVQGTRIADFAASVSDRRGLDFGDPLDFDRLWQWSIDHLDAFWGEFADWSGIVPGVPDDKVLLDRSMPGAKWFRGRTVNYAERALACRATDHPALIIDQEGVQAPVELSWEQLRHQVGALAATFRGAGVVAGDRVAGYLPNIAEAVVAILAAASIGAVWASCAPDFGTSAVLDRLRQIEPVVLIAVDGYRFAGRSFDRRDVVAELRSALPSVRTTILISRVHRGETTPGTLSWSDSVKDLQEPVFAALPFDHPLWIVYSSGTTGLPKGIVHGHGGIALEQIKQAALHMDVRRGDRFFWYASTAWIMWNISLSALLCGATLVISDSAPAYPTVDAQFALAARVGLTHLGTGAGYLIACQKAGVHPGSTHDLAQLRFVGSTGSPLPGATFEWVYEAVGTDLVLGSFSGGTDVATSFLGSSPLLPVTAGELQRPLLGVAAASWDEGGQSVVDEVGELVVTLPMPSMPLYFWNDPQGLRYHQTYFEPWQGVWRHGDWVERTSRGTYVIAGRSDSTLNRGGVRMGTADIYAVVEAMPAIADCVILGIEEPAGGYWMPLFVKMTADEEFTDALSQEIRSAIRMQASPRHVPDDIIVVSAIPHTRTGKRLEVPLKRLFQGMDPTATLAIASSDDPGAVQAFAEMARVRNIQRGA